MASTGPAPRGKPWLAWLARSLGAFAVGVAGNLASNDIGFRGVVIGLAVAAILMAAAWLRDFRPDFALVVWVVRGLLLIAVAAVVAATMVRATQVGYVVLVAALATLGATLIRSDPIDRLASLCAVTLIAYGAGLLVSVFSADDMASEGRIISIIMGVLVTMCGVAALGQGRLVVALAKTVVEVLLEPTVQGFYALGGLIAFLAVLAATNGDVLIAAGMFLVAIGSVGIAVGHNRRRPVLVGLSAVLAGLPIALGGTFAVVSGEALLGAAAVGVGVTIIVTACTYLSRRGVPARWRRWLDDAKKDS